jgi:hypothetical protein
MSADLYKYDWGDVVLELITGNKYVKYGVIAICISIAIVGIILLSLYIPKIINQSNDGDKNDSNGFIVALGISLVLVGLGASPFVYKMEPPPHPE